MPSDDPKFTCPSCGKMYRWKPELAGRSAKCACGGKLVVPTEQPAVATPTKPSVQGAAGPSPAPPKTSPSKESNCPSCGASLPTNAVLCVACGYNLKTGQKLSAVVVVANGDEDNDDQEVESAPSSPEAAKPPK